MNRQLIENELTASIRFNPDAVILPPGSMSAEDTADHLITLLQAMYTQHGITNDREALVETIATNQVQTWFALINGQFSATASLIKQTKAWECGRVVSLAPQSRLGKRLVLEAALCHLDNHKGEPLITETRVADKHLGIPNSLPTQWLGFGILGLVPHAVAPLFEHGDPRHHETFALSSTDCESNVAISDRVAQILNNRTSQGDIAHLTVLQEHPFRLIVPNPDGQNAHNVIETSSRLGTCSLFAIEATDQNMPLLSQLITNPQVLLCGTDRAPGNNGLPVILLTTFHPSMAIAPTLISEHVPFPLRNDMQLLANQFTERGNQKK